MPDLRRKRSVFKHVTQTKKKVVATLISTFPVRRNDCYLEEIYSEVSMEAIFVKIKQ